MNDRERRELDQTLAGVRETLPALWWSLFAGCCDKGFTREQAFALVQAHILSQAPGGVNLPNPPKEPPKESNDA